jgi:hypothetical protein
VGQRTLPYSIRHTGDATELIPSSLAPAPSHTPGGGGGSAQSGSIRGARPCGATYVGADLGELIRREAQREVGRGGEG